MRLAPAAATVQAISLVDPSFIAASGSSGSGPGGISPDGRYVVFSSQSSNLVAGGTNGALHTFVRDTVQGSTTLVSTDSSGTQANGNSFNPAVAVDNNGTVYVAFVSYATNLVSGDTNEHADVFLKNLGTGVTTRVGTDSSGHLDANTPALAIDHTGTVYVAFQSYASSQYGSGIFVNNLSTGVTALVSTDSSGNPGNSASLNPAIAVDPSGTVYVAFSSYATNLVSGDINNTADVFVKNLSTGATNRVSTDSSGNQGNSASQTPALTVDGSGTAYVAFSSSASNLVSGDSNGGSDVFVKNLSTGATTRVSTDSSGNQANSDSRRPALAVAASGTVYVAFDTVASNLVSADTNNAYDVFVKNLSTGATTRVSTDSSSNQANGDSFSAALAIDSAGSVNVAFASSATNLVSGDIINPGGGDGFIKNLSTGATSLLSPHDPALPSVLAGFCSSPPSQLSPQDRDVPFQSLPFTVSPDGRYVAFQSRSPYLVPGDTNGVDDIFVRDTVLGTTRLVSTDSSGNQANGGSFSPALAVNASGTVYVAFYSNASNLVSGDTNNDYDVFVKNLSTGVTTRVNTDSSGNQANGIDFQIVKSYSPALAIASNGDVYVAFYSNANNLVSGDTNYSYDVFVKNLSTGVTTCVSTDSSGNQGNGDSFDPALAIVGSGAHPTVYVSFQSLASNLVSGDTNNGYDVFVKNLSTGVTNRVSTDSSGNEANNNSYNPVMAVDSSGTVYAAFDTVASNLVIGDTNNAYDVFVKNLSTGVTTRVSTDSSGNQANIDSASPALAIDGSGNLYVAFESYANNLVGGDTNNAEDVFVKNLTTGGTTRVSTDSSGNQAIGNLYNNGSYYPSLAVDGSGTIYVAFSSDASNLVAGDYNGSTYYSTDVFLWRGTTPPTARLTMPTVAQSPGSAVVRFTLTAFGDSAANQSAGFAYTINWGDGTTQSPDVQTIAATANNGSGVAVNHTYTADGIYVVQLTAQDQGGAISPRATGEVVLASTAGADHVEISGTLAGQVIVSVSNTSTNVSQTSSPTDLVLVSASGGLDTYTVNFGSTLTIPVTVFGGGSGDTLIAKGSAGDNNFVKKTAGKNTIAWGPQIGPLSVAPLETVTYSGVANVIINGGPANNYIEDPGSNTIINGGSGTNTIVITATSGTGVVINGGGTANTYIVDLGSLAGPVTINNSNVGAGNNVIVNAPAGNNTITASGKQVTEAAQTVHINTSSLSSLAIMGGPDADQITVSNFSVPVQSFSVAGGAGNDQITISSPAATVGSVTVDGGTGSDTVALNNLGTQVTALTVAGGDGDQIQVQGALPPQVHLPPTVAPITVPSPVRAVNNAVSASAAFSDLDGGSHTASWNWGDNTSSAGTLTPQTSTTGSVSGSHTYTATGVYTVTLTVTDSNQQGGTATFQFVAIYDPSAGFVTGGGWITSPAGAYAANPSLTGKANFGFESKYKKGANLPSGNTQFSFAVGNLDFHSTSYDWLVIAGAKGQYKGSGQINYTGNYAFMLTAIDGDLPGGNGQDKFRIKIWDKATNAMIYDNDIGASDTGNPTTVIGGGSIVIHSSNQLLNEVPLEGNNPTPLTLQQVQPIEEEAIRLWVAAGAKRASFRDVSVQIVDLPGSALGLAAGDTIWLDKDAAGHGWFVDLTPAGRSELAAGISGYLSPGHTNQVDLLTVVAHELGHVLGYEDSGTTGLMAEYLATGIRRLPTLTPSGDQTGPPLRPGAAARNPGLSSLRPRSRTETGSTDIPFTKAQSSSGSILNLLAGPEATLIDASSQQPGQPPPAALQKKGFGWAPLRAAAQPSQSALDATFADLGWSDLSTDFTDWK